MAVEAHTLLQKPEQMLDGKAPQVHMAQVLRRNLFRAGPEEPQRTFVTRRAVFLQELYTDHRPFQFGQPLEMQLVPDTHLHLLFAQGKSFSGIRFRLDCG